MTQQTRHTIVVYTVRLLILLVILPFFVLVLSFNIPFPPSIEKQRAFAIEITKKYVENKCNNHNKFTYIVKREDNSNLEYTEYLISVRSLKDVELSSSLLSTNKKFQKLFFFIDYYPYGMPECNKLNLN